MSRQPVVISYGGGTNSTALITGMVRKNLPIDLVMFADTGCELPAAQASPPFGEMRFTAPINLTESLETE